MMNPSKKESSSSLLAQVKQVFTTFLEKEGYRKTPERYQILEEIYKIQRHFDVDELHAHMRQEGHKVSRATLYNTLELLRTCDLVAQHQFSPGLAHYEASYGRKQHHHVVCLTCSKVMEFCDPRIGETERMAEDIFQLRVTHRSLILYGECRKPSCPHAAP